MKSYVVRRRASGEVNTVAAARAIQKKRLKTLRRAPVDMHSDIVLIRISSYSPSTNAYRVFPQELNVMSFRHDSPINESIHVKGMNI